jgi:hypothetical protein
MRGQALHNVLTMISFMMTWQADDAWTGPRLVETLCADLCAGRLGLLWVYLHEHLALRRLHVSHAPAGMNTTPASKTLQG